MKSLNKSLVVIVALVAIFFGNFISVNALTGDNDPFDPNQNPINNINLPTPNINDIQSETFETPTPFIDNEDPTPTPEGGNIIEDNIFDVCIPFITNCVTPTVTPTPTVEVRITPTPTVTPDPTAVPVGGSSNNTSSSSSSSSPSTGGGQVLGATTLGSTGVFEETLANFAMFAGTLLMGAGSMLHGKKKS